MAGDLDAQQDFHDRAAHEQAIANLRLLWESRRFLGRVTGVGLVLSVVIALLIPSRYQSVTRLMPPDNQSSFRRPRHGSGGAFRRQGWSGGLRGHGKRTSGSEEH